MVGFSRVQRTQMKNQKTLSEALGGDIAARLIELFADDKKVNEVIALMPEAHFTIGRVVSIRRRYKKEIAHNIEALEAMRLIVPRQVRRPPLKKAPEVPKIDEAKEFEIIDEALREWNALKGFRRASAFAAMQVNKARIAAGIKTPMTNADEVELMLAVRRRKSKTK